MKNKQQLLTFYLLITTITTHGMNQIVEYSWYNVPTEVKIGVIACADVPTKKNLCEVNKELSALASTANFPRIVMHYPCILDRDTHLKFMINYSRQKDEQAKKVIACLIKNAPVCDHADVLDIVPHFFAQKILPNAFRKDELNNTNLCDIYAAMIQCYKDNLNNQTLSQSLMPIIMEIYDVSIPAINEYLNRYCKTETETTHLHIAVEEGHSTVVELFVAEAPTLLHEIDGNGMIPLSLATQKGNLEIITLLQKYSKRSQLNIIKK